MHSPVYLIHYKKLCTKFIDESKFWIKKSNVPFQLLFNFLCDSKIEEIKLLKLYQVINKW